MQVAVVFRRRPGWPKSGWVSSALRTLGHTVHRVETRDALVSADRDCDLVLFEHRDFGIGRKVVRDLNRSGNAVWCSWWFDLFSTPETPLDQQSCYQLYGEGLRKCDVVFAKEPVELLRQAGITARYLDQGCPSDYPERPVLPPEYDVLLFGRKSPIYRQRQQDVRTLVSYGFKVAWAGSQGQVPKGCIDLPYCPVERLPDLMGRASVVLCVDYRHDIAGYASDRVWLACGAGAPVIRRWTPDFDPPCATYRSGDELVELVESALADQPSWRAKGEAARRETMAHHTYECRLREIIRAAEEIRDGRTDLPEMPWQESSEGEGSYAAVPGVRR